MATVSCFSNDILLRIFSFLPKYELLSLEKVSSKWKKLIQEEIWNKLTCITAKTVGYPGSDFVTNFIEIVHRVKQVKEFFTDLWYVHRLIIGQETRDSELKSAMMELLDKKTPDAIFPLDLIPEMLSIEYPSTPNQQPASVQEANAVVARVLKQLRVSEFEAIRADEMAAHDSETSFDSFVVTYNEREIVIPLPEDRIRRLHISWFRMRIADVDVKAVKRARTKLTRISKLNRLESVQINNVQLVVPNPHPHEEAFIDLLLSFHPNKVQMSASEFRALLKLLANDNDFVRNKKVLRQLKEWKNTGVIKKAEVRLHSSQFARLEPLMGGTINPAENVTLRQDPIGMILFEFMPSSLTTKFTLAVSNVFDGESEFLRLLQEKNVLRHIKDFTITFEPDIDGYGKLIEWDDIDAARRARALLRCLCTSMQQYESLHLMFYNAGRISPCSMFAPIAVVSQPLPALHELCCNGFPSFPFILSAIQNAPNLTSLSVVSEPFEDDHVGLALIGQTLEALENTKLCCLRLEVIGPYKPSGYAPKRATRGDRSEFKAITDELRKRLDHLTSRLSSLHRVDVHLKNCDFRYDLENEDSSQRENESDESDESVVEMMED